MDIVTYFTDLASKWIKEHDTREIVIDMIIMMHGAVMHPPATNPRQA